MKVHMKYQRGFTLLELLVVVSIIGILIAMIMAGFSTAQTRSRDARRRGDIKSAQNAFEQYYASNNGSYAASCATMATAATLPGGLPVDPQTGTTYTCTSSPSTGTNTYCICAALEAGSGGNYGNNNCTGGAPLDHFCATNLQ